MKKITASVFLFCAIEARNLRVLSEDNDTEALKLIVQANEISAKWVEVQEIKSLPKKEQKKGLFNRIMFFIKRNDDYTLEVKEAVTKQWKNTIQPLLLSSGKLSMEFLFSNFQDSEAENLLAQALQQEKSSSSIKIILEAIENTASEDGDELVTLENQDIVNVESLQKGFTDSIKILLTIFRDPRAEELLLAAFHKEAESSPLKETMTSILAVAKSSETLKQAQEQQEKLAKIENAVDSI